MSLLGEGTAHPNAPLEKTREGLPLFSFFLTAERRPTGRSPLEPCVREREREVRRKEEKRERSRAQLEGKEKWAREIQSKAILP